MCFCPLTTLLLKVSVILCFFTVDVLTSKSGNLIYLNGSGYIPYHQQLKNLNDNLWCVGGINDDTEISWILPNGEILNSFKNKSSHLPDVMVKETYTAEGHVLSLSLGSNSKLSGVYTCRVNDRIIDRTTDMQHLWIIKNRAEPIVKDYSCILESSLVYNNLHVILLSAYVTQGAPTTIKCHLANSSVGYELTKITEERILENRNVSRVLVGYLIPFSMTPNEVKCTIANGDGSDSFKCSIQESGLKPPVVKSVIEKSSSQYIVQWYPIEDPNNLLTHYTVYYKTNSNKTIKQKTSSTEAVIDTSSFNKESLRVVANSEKKDSQAVILLPSIGELTNQCMPSSGSQLRLVSYDNRYATNAFVWEVLNSLDMPSECSVLEPKIINTRIVTDSTRRRTGRRRGKRHKKGKSKGTKKGSKSKSKGTKKGSKSKSKGTKKGSKSKSKGTKSKKKGSKTRSKGRTINTTIKSIMDVLVVCNPCVPMGSHTYNNAVQKWLNKTVKQGQVVTVNGIEVNVTLNSTGQYCNYELYDRNTKCNCSTLCLQK